MEIRNPYTSHKIRVQKSTLHRYGIFAKQALEKGEVLEEVPSIIIPVMGIDGSVERMSVSEDCAFSNFVFMWPCSKEWRSDFTIQYRAVPFGYGCLYNHSSKNNATWDDSDLCEGAFKFFTVSDIKEGEEILINYGDILQVTNDQDEDFLKKFNLGAKMNSLSEKRGPHLSEESYM